MYEWACLLGIAPNLFTGQLYNVILIVNLKTINTFYHIKLIVLYFIPFYIYSGTVTEISYIIVPSATVLLFAMFLCLS